MLKKLCVFVFVLLTGIMTQTVKAATVNLTPSTYGQWNTFDVDSSFAISGGLEWIDANGEPLAFKFTLTTPTYLKIVDGGFAGDVFEIFDNGLSLGLTSGASNSYPNSLSTNFDAAFANLNYSQRIFLLGVGTHEVTGRLTSSALDDTSQALNATVGAVSLMPEPSTIILFLTGGAAAWFGHRKA